ncbi:MAG: radical SAM protein [Chitinivibrionales bacterium]|nr:radical SAM protein [Chitinivibrionales bacterium]
MKPLLLHYFITNRCNAHCTFCDIWKQQPKIDARLDDVIKNLADARRAGCKFVDFTGGEPLLHPDLPLFLKAARRIGFFTSVTTNCLLFAERAAELTGLIDLLHFSLDADTPELHNKIRGVDSFDAVLKCIPVALVHKLVPDILFTYTNENIDTFKGVYDLAKKNRLIVILDPVFDSGGADAVSKQTHAKAQKYAKSRGVYLNRAHLALREKGGNNTKKPACKAVTSTIVILPDNSLVLPCFHHCQEKLNLGNGLAVALKSQKHGDALLFQGAYSFCEGCHINCYFDPSYQYLRNRLWPLSQVSKLSYVFAKYIYYRPNLLLPAFLRLAGIKSNHHP